jgi:hypothetical protein
MTARPPVHPERAVAHHPLARHHRDMRTLHAPHLRRRRPEHDHTHSTLDQWLAPHELSAETVGPAPIGWYPDPAGGPGRRLWDGAAWTDHVWVPRRARG